MFLVLVGDNLEVLGVEWAETCSSELRLGVVSMEACPPGLCRAVTGVDWAVGGY